MKKGKSYSAMNELSALLRKATTLTGAHNTVFMAHYAHPNFVLQNFINTETVRRNASIEFEKCL